LNLTNAADANRPAQLGFLQQGGLYAQLGPTTTTADLLPAPGYHQLRGLEPHKYTVIEYEDKALASCSIDGKIVLVSPEKPDQAVFEVSFDQQKPVSVNSCAFSSNSRYIAAGGTDSLVKIWDMRSSNKEVPTVLRSHFGSVTSVAWSKLDDVVASSSMIGDIFLNSARNGNVIENFASKSQESINMIRFSQGDTHNRLGACTSSGSVL
jgi:WD40 repeat protein